MTVVKRLVLLWTECRSGYHYDGEWLARELLQVPFLQASDPTT